MRAVEQWNELERSLPEGWEEARFSFAVEDPASAESAAEVLAPLGPGRSGTELRFHVRPSGLAGTESVRNLVGRLDRKRIWGELVLVDVRTPERPADHTAARAPSGRLVEAWDDAVQALPPDWSDLLCELEVDSSDFLPQAALLGAPLNPTRNPNELALRFRVAHRGYGASPPMVRRCFERMDEAGVTGRVAVVHALSEVGYAATQGPVWRIAGHSV